MNESNAHISHMIHFWHFLQIHYATTITITSVISKADKGSISNTLTESLRNELKIKKPTVK